MNKSFLQTGDGKVTLKWHNQELYLWPGSVIRDISVRNGIVHGPNHRKVYYGRDANWMIAKLPKREAGLLQLGFCVAVPAELLQSKRLIDNYPYERGKQGEAYYGRRVER